MGHHQEEKAFGSEYPAWAGIYEDYNTTTTKAVIDASFSQFQTHFHSRMVPRSQGPHSHRRTANLNTSEVKSMNSMFEDCVALTTLDLKSFNTSR